VTSARPGVEGFLAARKWRGPRLGLIAHAASVRPDLTPTALALRRAGFRLTALFAPEHGLTAALQDQAPIQGARDKTTGLPVFSLYGKTLAPTPAMLDTIDAMVFDLQDIGVRYYTFVWTLALALAACARAQKPFIVLDRPNPLGDRLDGNLPDPDHLSFVGLHPVPVQHGLTAGEIALWLNGAHALGRRPSGVSRSSGWRRGTRFDVTGLPWVSALPQHAHPGHGHGLRRRRVCSKRRTCRKAVEPRGPLKSWARPFWTAATGPGPCPGTGSRA
jgi:uncharacterized protein YbbC (DUF1343 family)